jgi:hypothetical protein
MSTKPIVDRFCAERESARRLLDARERVEKTTNDPRHR